MNETEIKAMQQRIRDFGFDLEVDGFWGPQSQKACRAYLRSLCKNNPWPTSDRKSVEAFFGKPGDENNLVSFTFPFPTFYGQKRVLTSRCHHKVKDSLLRVLNNIGDLYGSERSIIEEAEDYGGIYNFRPKRGGSSLSLHSWGIAIDLDADDNSFRNNWPMQADMPLEIMEEFAKEGWTSAGAFWGYDAMHFQATRS
jgi:hypothetical protein